jgi:hypothetical protein
MVRRSERLTREEVERRLPDRRQHSRRKTDVVKAWLKYLAVALLAAVVAELVRR